MMGFSAMNYGKVPEKLQFNLRRMFTGPKKGQSVKTFAVLKHHRSTNKTRWLLHCSQSNKFMPLESFELIDAVAGHRGTVSSFGQERNVVSNFDISSVPPTILPIIPHHCPLLPPIIFSNWSPTALLINTPFHFVLIDTYILIPCILLPKMNAVMPPNPPPLNTTLSRVVFSLFWLFN